MTAEICGDNRFEIIEAAKARLLDATNIEQAPDEMAVLDSLLFRMWQMGWLPGQERTCHDIADCTGCWQCSLCGVKLYDPLESPTLWDGYKAIAPRYCPNCRAKVVS